MRGRSCTRLAAVSIFCLAAQSFAGSERPARLAAAFPEVEKIFERFREKKHIPGLAFGVVVDGELAYAKGLGVRDIASGAPVDLDTVFRIASMTKSFTALAILKLRDDRRLSLDDPAAKHIPELRSLHYPTADSPPITIRQLLTHGAGFQEDDPWGDRQLGVSHDELSQWLRRGLPFSAAPGTAFEYSNYGYALLGRIVNRASGRPYRDYVDAEIVRPLGFEATKWEASAVPADRLASGYRWEDERWSREEPLGDGAFAAMGGLYMSARDLARYVAFFLSAWPARDDPDPGPVRRSSSREMQQPARFWELSVERDAPGAPLRAAAWSYGYGLSTGQTCRFRLAVGHSGGLPGFGSNMRWLPEYGVGIFALANRTYASPGDAVLEALEVLAAAGAIAPRAVPPSPALLSARDGVLRLMERWDDAVAAEIAAGNLFLDESVEARRKRLAELRSVHGACRADGDVQVRSALRGRWRMACERGFLEVSIWLAPTQPPKVQVWEITSNLPAPEPLRASLAKLVALGGAWDQVSAEALLAPSADRGKVRATLQALARDYGACRVGESIDDGGEEKPRVLLTCARGALLVDVAAESDGRLRAPTFSAPPDTVCVP